MNSTRLLTAACSAACSAAALLVMTGCAGTAAPASTTSATAAQPTASTASADCAGVTVVVDPGELEGARATSTCVPTDEAITGAVALKRAKVTTEGTAQYGNQVVCRVNGVPASDQDIQDPDGGVYHEICQTMPAAFAYWGLWVKPAGGEWGYAQEGLSTLPVQPGESVELLFTLNGSPATPAP